MLSMMISALIKVVASTDVEIFSGLPEESGGAAPHHDPVVPSEQDRQPLPQLPGWSPPPHPTQPVSPAAAQA